MSRAANPQMLNLYHYSLTTIILAGAAVGIVAIEIGHWAGAHAGDRADDNVPVLEAAAIGLLALMIGFTFSMTLSRFEARRDAVLAEANAIGTTALRARLLPEPHRQEVLQLLREYVKIRVDLIGARDLTKAIEKSTILQEKLWQHAEAMRTIDNRMVPTGLFIETLNEMIDDQAKRLAILRNRVPAMVLLVLAGICVIALGLGGFTTGVDKRRSRLPVYAIGLLAGSVIFLILDLENPTVGFIEVNQQPMIDAALNIAGFAH